ncbi:MAG: protein kinase [Gemmataceae bacterium]|nr:protein kinase [Gemmataceae bacterium]
MPVVDRVPDLLNSNLCPEPDLLAAYNLGTLPAAPMSAVARHLECCPRCLGALEALGVGGDPLVACLAQPSPPPPFTDEECEHVLERVQLLYSSAGWMRTPEPPPAPVIDETLKRVGEYEVLQLLGRGGMGAVYKARQIHLSKIVALKVLPADRARSAAARTFLLQEMKALGGLNHPNIVLALDAHVEPVPYLAMEFLEGADLGKVVRARGRLPVADACECIRQAAIGLQYAHENGLVHRDIKPSNLMLTPDGTVKVLDLGLARLLENAGPIPSPESFIPSRLAPPMLGTVEYMAPEQFLDCHGVDIRADVYSLGCTFYHLLTGQSPFGKPGLSSQARMEAHLRAPVPPVTRARPDVPEAVADILDRMLLKRREDRFATPAEVALALQPFTAGASLRRLLPRVETVQAGVPSDPPRLGGVARLLFPPDRPPARRRSPLLAVAAALALLAVASLVIVLGLRRGGSPTPSEALQVEAFQVTHLRSGDGADFELGELGVRSPAAGVERDSVRISVRFNQPAHCYLIAFRPDGKEDLCWPTRPDRPTTAAETLTYPPVGTHRLAQAGMGTQAFVLVASRQQLPAYAAWKGEQGVAPWGAREVKGVWQFDGNAFTPSGRPLGNGLKAEENGPGADFELLCRFYHPRPGVEVIRAVVFPVLAQPPPVADPHTP